MTTTSAAVLQADLLESFRIVATTRLPGGVGISSAARIHHAADFVIDPAINDKGAIGRRELPISAHAVIHRASCENDPGAIEVPASIRSPVVNRSDVTAADDMSASARADGPALLYPVRTKEAPEAEIKRQIAEDRYIGAYGKPA